MRALLATSSPPLEILIRRSLARFRFDWESVDNGFDAFQKAITGKHDLLVLDFDLKRMTAPEILRRLAGLPNFKQPSTIVLTLSEEQRIEIEHGRFLRTQVVSRPMAIRKFVSLVQQSLHQGVKIACLGGGTGLFTLLSGLKTVFGITLASIVSMSDDGGSTGQLRDMFGILPPGDIRRSLVALSTAPDLLNELIQYRFIRGAGLEGHNLGNLLLTALSEMRGSMTEAVKALSEVLNIQGEVIPVTEKVNTLKAELKNGAILSGEHRIDLFEGQDPSIPIARVWLEPDVEANADALEAIMSAQFIILGPGDLFTSVIPNLVVSGISEALGATKAKKIYICNLMTKPGETTNFKVSDHIREIVKYLGKDILDCVLCSSTQFSHDSLKRYAQKNQIPVIETSNKSLLEVTKAKIVWEDVASETELVRHDSLKLAAELKKIFESEGKH